ncbi:kinase-like domain-containing protein [Cunninghamella echinulata]|nr:kinase-like domain-containing protein [Cunninghamella echinulata]
MTQPTLQNPMSLLKPTTPTTQPTLDPSFATPPTSSNSNNNNSNSHTMTNTAANDPINSRASHFIKSTISGISSQSSSRRQSSASLLPKRSPSISEALHLKLSALTMAAASENASHNEASPQLSPYPSSVASPSMTSLSQAVSETNWANKYEDFDIKQPIGYGSSAIVYAAIYLPMKKWVALKMIDLDMFERNQIDELRRETALMALSKHPNVLKVYGSFVNGSKLYIITPYLSFGSCLDIMKTSFKDGFEEYVIATILKQALEGLVYLHKNGHIHRDVKAGNLLMDDQGTVLLADFGVSSSLSERGDIRKTFVGTPCWMAPEVMEQDGYDFKADIWSFGITAYELATGHAPFAKYPPLKVLKLTLSSEPPTLDDAHTKYNYSRVFKEMIELCLQKDPDQRPTAEKLLQHPFFKQAKKRDYLVKSVLAYVPPIDQRPHRKLPQKRVSYEVTDQWNFDDDEGDADESNNNNNDNNDNNNDNDTQTLPSPLITDTTANKRTNDDENRETIDNQQQLLQRKPSSSLMLSAPEETAVPVPKRHITFGDVVIRDTSNNRSKSPIRDTTNRPKSPSIDIQNILQDNNNNNNNNNSYTTTTFTTTNNNNNNNNTSVTTKKSRFIIEEPDHVTQPSPPSSSSGNTAVTSIMLPSNGHTSASTSPNEKPDYIGSGLGIINNPNNNTKHRHSVQFTEVTYPLDYDRHHQDSLHKVNSNHSDTPTTPLSRVASYDTISERKSRFEIQHSTPSGNLADQPSSAIASPLSRDGSSTSLLSQKLSRFLVEKPDDHNNSPLSTVVDARKIGRFELTGRTGSVSSMSSSEKDPFSSSRYGGSNGHMIDTHTLYTQMEQLLKQTDAQKALLNECMLQLSSPQSTYHHHHTTTTTPSRSRSVSISSDVKRSTSDHDQKSSMNEMTSTIDQLQHLLSMTLKEKEKLTKENKLLKIELEKLQQSSTTSSNNTTSPTVSNTTLNTTT